MSRLATLIALLFATPAQAQSVDSLLSQLRDPAKAEGAVDGLVEHGLEAVQRLTTTAQSSSDVAARGWAVLAISRIPGKQADDALEGLQNDANVTPLVQTWAAAARVRRAGSAEQLFALAKLQSRFPALDRPLKKRISEVLGEDTPTEELLRGTVSMPQLAGLFTPMIIGRGIDPLVEVMVKGTDNDVRRQAAAYLATLGQQEGPKAVGKSVVAAYKFSPKAKDVAWKGGALFLPGLQWTKEEGTALVSELMAWMIFCDRNGKSDEHQQLHNNLRSLNLARVVGYQSPAWSDADAIKWLTVWGSLVGKQSVAALLRRQGVDKNARYKGVLDGLK